MIHEMALYVGTSGWAYREWKPAFYPSDVPRPRFLEHYARRLTACEVNATFYRLQSERTLCAWAALTPPSFRFAAKAHRRLTHSRKTALEPDQRLFLDAFLTSVSVLGARRGPILFQFPPNRARDDDHLAGLVGALPPGTTYACEFRHRSWDCDEVRHLIAASGGTVCVSDLDGAVLESLPPGLVGYVRLRASHYGREERDAWRELLLREAQSRDVYAFTKHGAAPASDASAGVALAAWLVETTRATPAGRARG